MGWPKARDPETNTEADGRSAPDGRIGDDRVMGGHLPIGECPFLQGGIIRCGTTSDMRVGDGKENWPMRSRIGEDLNAI